MGLYSSPVMYQRMMNTLIEDKNDKSTNVYLDDVVAFSKGFKSHQEHLEIVFYKFREEGLKLKLSKCLFAKREVKYLGHAVSAEGVRPNSNKIAAVRNYPMLKTVAELRTLLELLSYYRKLVKLFCSHSTPADVVYSQG